VHIRDWQTRGQGGHVKVDMPRWTFSQSQRTPDVPMVPCLVGLALVLGRGPVLEPTTPPARETKGGLPFGLHIRRHTPGLVRRPS
jgi:hypothetical protein